jgi:hypothetical protein
MRRVAGYSLHCLVAAGNSRGGVVLACGAGEYRRYRCHNALLTPDQARTHVGYIQQHLLGTDGARLFNRPPPYWGGPQRYFQRAESRTFFGREIGIMYMHAHLRYAQAMAHDGDSEAFFLALRQANPPVSTSQTACFAPAMHPGVLTIFNDGAAHGS